MSDLATEHLSESQFRRIVVPMLVLLALFCYGNTFDGEFVWDDVSSVLVHEDVRDPSKFLDLFKKDQHAFAGGQGNFYRPLVSASFMLDYAFAADEGGAEEWPGTFYFHLTNTLWHAATTVLLFFLMSRLGAPGWARLAVCTAYVVHPLHTEAVTYISGRADPMSGAFMFAGLLFATMDESPGRRAAGALLSAACFVGALLCKESALVFPALLVLVLACRRLCSRQTAGGPGLVQQFIPLAPALMLVGVYVYLRTTVLNFGSDSETPASTFIERGREVLESFWLYMGLIIAPRNLHMERSLAKVAEWAAIGGGVLLLIVVVLLVYAAASKQWRAALGLSWFLIAWLPISGLFPLNASMAEHWMYIPLAGLLWGLAELVWRESSSPRTQRAALVLSLVWCTGLLATSVNRNEDWHDNVRLFEATVRENPESIRAQFMLGLAYEDAMRNPAGAKRHFHAVIDLFEKQKLGSPEKIGNYWIEELDAHVSLGTMYLQDRQYNEAVEHLSLVASVEPNDENTGLVAEAALRLGQYFHLVGDSRLATAFFGQAVELEPGLQANIQAILGSEVAI